jgi:hypothetical protein
MLGITGKIVTNDVTLTFYVLNLTNDVTLTFYVLNLY